MGQAELRGPILLGLRQVDDASITLSLDEMDDPLTRSLEAQPFRMGAHLPELPREMGNPPVSEDLDGERVGERASPDRQQPCRFGRHGVTVVGRLIEARFGQKPAPRPLQNDLTSGFGPTEQPNLSGDYEEHRLKAVAAIE